MHKRHHSRAFAEQRKWIEGRLVEVKRDLEKSESILKEFRERNRRVIDSPQLMLEQERLIREVEINSTLYTELKKQYEIVKIEEIKNIPVISVMDAARPAQWRERPKKRVIVAAVFLVSLIGSWAYVLALQRYKSKIVELYHRLSIQGKSR